jgi:hypothetical protein
MFRFRGLGTFVSCPDAITKPEAICAFKECYMILFIDDMDCIALQI